MLRRTCRATRTTPARVTCTRSLTAARVAATPRPVRGLSTAPRALPCTTVAVAQAARIVVRAPVVHCTARRYATAAAGVTTVKVR